MRFEAAYPLLEKTPYITVWLISATFDFHTHTHIIYIMLFDPIFRDGKISCILNFYEAIQFILLLYIYRKVGQKKKINKHWILFKRNDIHTLKYD